MLDLFGRGYVIDHVLAVLEERAEEKRLNAYITDALMLIGENTARFVEGGKYLKERWLKVEAKKDERTGDEVAMDIIKRAGLRLKGGEEDGT